MPCDVFKVKTLPRAHVQIRRLFGIGLKKICSIVPVFENRKKVLYPSTLAEERGRERGGGGEGGGSSLMVVMVCQRKWIGHSPSCGEKFLRIQNPKFFLKCCFLAWRRAPENKFGLLSEIAKNIFLFLKILLETKLVEKTNHI